MKKIRNLKVRSAALVLLASSMITLCACEKELAPTETYDIVGTQTDESGVSLTTGLKQVLDVPGRDFKLVTEYTCDDSAKREWRITSDKFLYLKVNTQGLNSDTEVYIDNVHIDTSIKSKYAVIDGILQDSMDDHVHSSKLIGFHIDDNSGYYGVNAIEGCNQEFLSITGSAFNGYGSVTSELRRRVESEYLDKGVYANKVQVVYDLLVKGPDDKDFTNVSISSDFLVPVSSKIEYEDGKKTYTKSK